MTLVERQYEPVDCGAEPKPFPSKVVITCIRFVPPSASQWLMHFAIAHSVTQLNLKSYEVMVWISGNSPWVRRVVGALIFLSLATCIVLFFTGFMREFVSSWLSFVMVLSIPLFLWQVYQSGKVLEALWKEESTRVQQSIEQHLNSALSEFDVENAKGADYGGSHGQRGVERKAILPTQITHSVSMRARNLLKTSGLDKMLHSKQAIPSVAEQDAASASDQAESRFAMPSSEVMARDPTGR